MPDENQCRCLRCRLRDTINEFYAEEHGDKPGPVPMDLDDSLAALGLLAAELFSVYADPNERADAIAEHAGAIAKVAEEILKEGRVPEYIEVDDQRDPDAPVH